VLPIFIIFLNIFPELYLKRNYSGFQIDVIKLIFRILDISRKVRKDYRKKRKKLIANALRFLRLFNFAFFA